MTECLLSLPISMEESLEIPENREPDKDGLLSLEILVNEDNSLGCSKSGDGIGDGLCVIGCSGDGVGIGMGGSGLGDFEGYGMCFIVRIRDHSQNNNVSISIHPLLRTALSIFRINIKDSIFVNSTEKMCICIYALMQYNCSVPLSISIRIQFTVLLEQASNSGVLGY